MMHIRHLVIAGAITAASLATSVSAAVIEDFETGGYGAAWQQGNATGFGTVSTAVAHDGSYGVSDGNLAWLYRTDAAATITDGSVLSAWVYTGDGLGRFYLGFGASAAGTSSFALGPNTSQLLFQNNTGYFFADTNVQAFTFSLAKWYLATVAFSGSTVTGSVYDSDGTTLLASLVGSPSLAYGVGGGVAVRSFGGVGYDTIALTGAGVPEAATWAMLIAGFGLTGAAMRRRFALAA